MTDLLTEPGTGLDDHPAFGTRPSGVRRVEREPSRSPGRWAELLVIGVLTVAGQVVVHAVTSPAPVIVRVVEPPPQVVTVQPAAATPSTVAAPTTVPAPAPSPSPSPTAPARPATHAPSPAPASTPPDSVGGLLEYLKSIGYEHRTEQP